MPFYFTEAIFLKNKPEVNKNPAPEIIHEKIKVHSLGERKHLLLVDESVISFRDQKLSLQDVTHFKFGLRAIQVYRFTLGWQYQLSIVTPSDYLEIKLTVLFKIQNQYFTALSHQIVDAIWPPIGERLFKRTVALLKAGGKWDVGNCQFSKAGIIITQSTGFSRKQYQLPWTEVSYEKKYDRLVINSKYTPGIWTNLYFLEHWNVDIAMNILDWLLEEDGINQLDS
jgi:hypothetical protein